MYQVLDLFSGIGGFSLGLERTGGFKTVAFCEIEKYPQKVLRKHWPDVPIYEDVRNVTRAQLHSDGIFPNVITGGFPCQDISVAGKQKGIEAERSGLWSECARLLGEIRPDYAIFENVTAILSGDSGRWMQRVLWDISQVGYDAEWHCIPASELGAYHHRDRVWIICYPKHSGLPTAEVGESDKKGNGSDKTGAVATGKPAGSGCEKLVSNTASERQPRQGESFKSIFATTIKEGQTINAVASSLASEWSIEPELGRVADGIPNRSHRLKGLGNAVVPQIPELIGRAILEHEQ